MSSSKSPKPPPAGAAGLRGACGGAGRLLWGHRSPRHRHHATAHRYRPCPGGYRASSSRHHGSRWCIDPGLPCPAIFASGSVPRRRSGCPWQILPRDLREFAEEHHDAIRCFPCVHRWCGPSRFRWLPGGDCRLRHPRGVAGFRVGPEVAYQDYFVQRCHARLLVSKILISLRSQSRDHAAPAPPCLRQQAARTRPERCKKRFTMPAP